MACQYSGRAFVKLALSNAPDQPKTRIAVGRQVTAEQPASGPTQLARLRWQIRLKRLGEHVGVLVVPELHGLHVHQPFGAEHLFYARLHERL